MDVLAQRIFAVEVLLLELLTDDDVVLAL